MKQAFRVRLLVGALTMAGLAGCAVAPPRSSTPAPVAPPTSVPQGESAYNQGVYAYRIEDYAAARRHWSRAVAEGETLALNNLGFLLFNGLGGRPDRRQAVALWTRAARLGVSESQWHLGTVYADGEALPRNAVEAYAWYRCALTSADRAPPDERDKERAIAGYAQESMAQLLPRMSPAERRSGEELARRYIARYARRPPA